MAVAEHRIGRVVFEIAAPDRDTFDRFGDMVRACFDEVAVPALQAALDRIEYLLSIPSKLSVPLLKLDPKWDPLRQHPRFKALVGDATAEAA